MLHPAISALRPMGNQTCASSMALSIGLWWQYTLSISIAGLTLLSLRYPLSRIFRFVADHPTVIFPPLLCFSVVPGLLWYGLHGYSPMGHFCFYGASTDIGAEAMLFVPRVVTSVGIIAMYTPLIPFLARPDIGAAYMDTSLSNGQRSRSRSRSLTTSLSGLATPLRQSHSKQSPDLDQPIEDVPAWEKLSFPNYDELATLQSKHLSSMSMVSVKSLGRSRSTSGDGSLRVALSPDLSTPDPEPMPLRAACKGHHRSETLPSATLSTFVPPPAATPIKSASRISRPHTAAAAAAAAAPFGASTAPPRVSFLDMLGDAASQQRQTPRRCRANTISSSMTPFTPAALLSPVPADGRERLSSCDSQATAVERPRKYGAMYFPDLDERRASASSEATAVSTETVSTIAASLAERRSSSDKSPLAKESMDSYMRRQTRKFLIWFPLIVRPDGDPADSSIA
jgi:hypothetical protein